MKRIIVFITSLFPICSFLQNPLFIPDTLSGTNFNLTVQTGSVEFFTGNFTPTYAVNGNILAPTLIFRKDDTVDISVNNTLPVPTTMHWHGFHVPAQFDGGPHQSIAPSTTWNPRFRIMNDAGTFWYHPHGNEMTEWHVTKGLAGMIIIRDTIESALNLPRTYGVDDFPLILQSKVFDAFYNFAGFTHSDSIMMVNATIDPYIDAPAQMVRFRVLNGSTDRTYMLGLSNDSSFYQIATDGGLLEQPNQTNRLMVSPAERVEIVVDLTGMQGQTIYLMSFASEIPNGIMGSADVSMGMASLPGYNDNPLNGNDFNVLQINVVAPTASPVNTIPSTLVSLNPQMEGTENRTRNFTFAPETMGPMNMIEGPFTINGNSFDMNVINDTVFLNHTEIWTFFNQTGVAHPFHIHDVQFYVLDRNGNPPGPDEQGQKDVVLVKPMETVRFITKFEDFHDGYVPYMYHCHLLHHEDEGMMGTFVVIDSTTMGIEEINEFTQFNIYPNPTQDYLNIAFDQNVDHLEGMLTIYNMLGQELMSTRVMEVNTMLDVSGLTSGQYFLSYTNGSFWESKKFSIVK